MPRYFQKIGNDTIALLAIIKKILMILTISGTVGTATMPENINPFIPLVLLVLREGIGEFIRIARTGKIEDDGQ